MRRIQRMPRGSGWWWRELEEAETETKEEGMEAGGREEEQKVARGVVEGMGRGVEVDGEGEEMEADKKKSSGRMMQWRWKGWRRHHGGWREGRSDGGSSHL